MSPLKTSAALGLSLFLFECDSAATPVEPAFREQTAVVLKGSAGMELINSCGSLGVATEQWDPTPEDIATLEAALAPALKSSLETMHDTSTPSEYFRQYAGGFYEGDHIIFVMGFHRSYFDTLPYGDAQVAWRQRVVPGGLGHTHYWCAYWVKETKYLIPTKALHDPTTKMAFHGRPVG
jgi:hypothetical protein